MTQDVMFLHFEGVGVWVGVSFLVASFAPHCCNPFVVDKASNQFIDGNWMGKECLVPSCPNQRK